jgi:threonine/homoserine/homoserine lactone efflux protein
MSDLSNPKIAVFFTSFLPQFVHTSNVFLPLVLLGVLFALLTLAWLAIYATLLGSLRLLRHPSLRKALDRITGIVLIAFGVRLALEHR